MEYIISKNVPFPRGCYSHAVKSGDFIFISGQLGILKSTDKLISENFCEQIRQCFQNIKLICEEVEVSLESIAKLTIYYISVDDRQKIDDVIKEFFPKNYPSRTRVVVNALSYGAKVEIDCMVYAPKKYMEGITQ